MEQAVDEEDPGALARRWIETLERAEAAQGPWRERAKKIIRRYKDERTEGDGERRYAILWSNIQTLGPAVYARTPQAVVARRFRDDDALARVASEVLERALNYALDAYDFDAVMRQCRDDYLLLGRGQAWVRYVPHLKTVRVPVTLAPAPPDAPEIAPAFLDAAGRPRDPAEVREDGQGLFVLEETVAFEEVVCDHVAWEDFGAGPARSWDEVRFVWRRAFLTREELVARFGEETGRRAPLDWGDRAVGDASARDGGEKACVYEIWDKSTKTALWISKAWPEAPLDRREDPLGLSGFFPCPRPLLATCAPDSAVPVPDYVYYQDQAEEIDELTARIGRLQEALRMVGVYAGEHGDALAQMFSGRDNTLVPVADYAALKGDGGVRGVIDWMPLDMVVQALNSCIKLRAQIIEDIYQITGVSDILRGATEPYETAAAQGLKAQWGALRVRDRQKELSRFARDLVRLKGEIVAGKFAAPTLKAMTGLSLFDDPSARAQAASAAGPAPDVALGRRLSAPSWAEVVDLLGDEVLRRFRIDIETDSSIEPDEQAEKARRIEFVGAFGQLIAQALPAVRAAPQLMPLVGETLKFVARGFRVSRELEDLIDEVSAGIAAASPQPHDAGARQGAPPPQPLADPREAEAKLTAAQARLLTAQTGARHAAAEAQLRAGDLQLKARQQQLDAAALARDPQPQAVVGVTGA